MNVESGFRTKPAVLKQIKENCLSTKPAEMYMSTTNEENSEFPRNMEQIYKVNCLPLTNSR